MRRRGEAFFDILTVLFLVATVAVVSATVLIISNPEAAINPLPPETVPALLELPSVTPTIPPTPTATASTTPLPTPIPTFTPLPTATATSLPTMTNTPVIAGAELQTQTVIIQTGVVVATNTPTPTLSPFPFVVSSIRYEPNTDERGCQLLAVAGNARGVIGEPVLDLPIRVVGDQFESIVFTGSDTRYGQGGFLVSVGFTPSAESYTIQLLGPTGLAVSEEISVQTADTCDRNIVVVEFLQSRAFE